MTTPATALREHAWRDAAFGLTRTVTWDDPAGGTLEVDITRTVDRAWRSMNLHAPEQRTLHAVTAAIAHHQPHPHADITTDPEHPGLTTATIGGVLQLLVLTDTHTGRPLLLSIERVTSTTHHHRTA